ncbi:unnamed protein product [Ophioblennius macclurei]
MNRQATDFQDSIQEPVQDLGSSRPLPADHVLSSGSVLFPGAFDRHGCPLIVFPADGQAKLSSELSKAEVVDFIRYFQGLHRKQDKQSLVSVVADLRSASAPAARFIAETLILLQLHQQTVHSAYIIQPKKKDVNKLLLKLLAPPKSYTASFKKVLLKEVPELSNHIDRSQLPASLGGYLMYCHQSWVAFVKDMDAFAQQFVSVVQRLPSCISTLRTLSRLPPPPSSLSQLQHFCSTNEAKFRQLRRELGLDELLRHCESLVEKLRYPESDPCYQDMAGTALFANAAFDMFHNHSRITSAVEKVDLLWQQAFSKARLQLQLLHLRDEALQTTEKIETLLQEKLQPYDMRISKDTAEAAALASEFEASVHDPAMALVRRAEEVIGSAAEVLPLDGPSKESWVLDLERLKDKLHSAVHYVMQTLQAVSNHHHYYDKANHWYSLVLHENFLQELLSGVHGDGGPSPRQKRSWGTIPAWRRKLSTFLKKNPSPDMEELLHLSHLSNAIPDEEIQLAGWEMSHRCMTLRKLLISSGPVSVGNLQKALQWQYHLLCIEHADPPAEGAVHTSSSNDSIQQVTPPPPLEGKLASLSSLDSGFDGAANGQMEAGGGRRRAEDSTDSAQPQRNEEKLSGAPDCQFDLGSVGSSSRASLHISPRTSFDSLSFEIKVSRSAAMPSNPWLSLPVDDLENSYTVTITPKATPQKGDGSISEGSHTPQGLPTQLDKGLQTRDWLLHSQSDLDDPELDSMDDLLSSTVTEGREVTVCTTEGVPTLLWDSYDFHHQNLDAADGEPDLPLSDWELTEQEGLRQVEQILGRTDQILEEEENVVAQEAVLDALLRSESGDQDATQMSSWELAEAGVVGLEDSFDPEVTASSDHHLLENPASAPASMRPDLLRELQKVHLLDRLIREESLEIHKLRCSDEALDDELLESKGHANVDGEAFREQLEKEKREVEKLEENLDEATKGVGCFQMGDDQEPGEPRTSVVDLTEEVTLKHTNESDVDLPVWTRTSLFTEGHSEDSVVDICQQSDDPEPLGRVSGPDVSDEASQQSELPSAQDEHGLESVPLQLDRHEDIWNPEPSSNPDSILGEGEEALFLSPLPKLGEVLLPGADSTESAASVGGLDELDAGEGHHMVLHPSGTEQSNNNNNRSLPVNSHTSELPSADGDASDRVSAPRLPSELWTSPCGPSESVRMSHSGSPGVRHQPSSTMRQMTDYQTPVVLDTGSGLMKAGFAERDLPHVVFPTIIGTPKYEEIMNGNLDRETYIGHEAQHMRGVLALRHPIKNGIIRCWDDMEKIWHHTFQQLRVDPEDHPVMLTEAAMNPLENRQRMVEIMFERFAVPFSYVAMQAVLALYADGRTTGVVLDSGDGVSHSVPVFEGYCLRHAVQRLPLAGADVTSHLRKLLQEQGVTMRTTAEEEIVREMKEKCCYVARNYEAELKQSAAPGSEACYTMPDGQVVTLATERFRAPEILFKPELIGRDHYGMHESLFKSVLCSDIDLRRSFLGNIVLSGGNTLLPGFPERLQMEMANLVPGDLLEGVRVSSPKDRDFSVWSGGAVLAGLPSFISEWISLEEYEEHGPQVVFRKCF